MKIVDRLTLHTMKKTLMDLVYQERDCLPKYALPRCKQVCIWTRVQEIYPY